MDVLLYDADCGFCTCCAAWLGRRVADLRVEPLGERPRPGLDAVRARREVPYLHAGGGTSWGSDAIGHALRRCGVPGRLAGGLLLAAPLRPVAHAAYALVARYRHLLPGGTAACRLG